MKITVREYPVHPDNRNYPNINTAAQPGSVLQYSYWKQAHIRKSCSAAAKWKRKFSVAGGKWCCFKPSSVILEFSHSSASDTKLARISFVLTEMSWEWTRGRQVRFKTQDFLQCGWITDMFLTLMTWLSDLSASSADWTIRWPMSLCNFPIAMASVVGYWTSVWGKSCPAPRKQSALRNKLFTLWTYCTFGTLGNCDDTVWEVHIHIKQVRSVAHFWIYKSCDVPCGEKEHIGA